MNPESTLSCQMGKNRWTLELTDTHFVRKWKGGRNSGEERIALSKLCPDLSERTGRRENTFARILSGLALLGLCVVLFLSVVQDKVPLLAPFVAIFAVWLLVLGLKGLKVQTWTVVHKEDGTSFAYFTHQGCDEVERKAFEEAYRNRFSNKNEQQPTTESNATSG